jgi:hypothetical protein
MLGFELSKENAVTFGLAVILPFLVYYGVSTAGPPPKYEDYQVKDYAERSESKSKEEKVKLEKEEERLHEAREAAEKRFEERLFEWAAPIGLAALIIGSFLRPATVGAGLMFGGLFTFTEGLWGQWRELPDGMKFAVLLIAAIAIVIIGYRRLPGKSVEVSGTASPSLPRWTK